MMTKKKGSSRSKLEMYVLFYYLDHFKKQAPEETSHLLNQWSEHLTVTEVGEDYFRGGVFDYVLVLISHDKGKPYLSVDYVGQDKGSDILFHNRSIVGGGINWKRLAYEPYDWGVTWESNTLVVYFLPNWVYDYLYATLAAVMSGATYYFGSKMIGDDVKLTKIKK